MRTDPDPQIIRFRGQDYCPLNQIPGYRSNINFANQSVDLQFSPNAFNETRVGLKMADTLTVDPAVPSVFFNYDVNYQRSQYRDAPNLDNLGIVSEVGYSSDLGVLTSSAVTQNLTGSSQFGNQKRYLRMETTLTMHRPDQRETLVIGDTSTRPGMLGSTTYFGGIRFGSNFGLTPGFIRNPVPKLSGSSSAPSTVNLYVNDVLRQTSNIPTGPFAIDNFPALTGGGEARLVVRDVLGRETVITQSFFTSSSLLAAGLDDWSVEAGRVRQELGTVSNDYGASFARGMWRHGYSDTLTVESVGEISPHRQNLELGLTSPLAEQWLGTAAIAASKQSTDGYGRQWLLGLEKQDLRTGVYLQAQGGSKNYRELGQDPDDSPVKLQLAGNASYAGTARSSFGAGFASIKLFNEDRVDTASINYSLRIGEHASLSLTASRSFGQFSGTAVGLSLVWPLSSRGPTISATMNRSGGQTDAYLAASQNPAQDGTPGWRVLAGQQQGLAHAEAGAQVLGRYGAFIGDVSTTTDQTTVRVSGSGGMVITDGHLFVTPRANQSYALIEVPGYRDIGVGLGSNVLSRTDEDGIALISNLAPYQQNQARLAAQDLPVSAEVNSIEMNVVPAWRTVVRVKFPVRSGRGALLTIHMEDHTIAPAGAIVQIEGDTEEFYVARRGQAFVTGLQAKNRVILKWKGRQCHLKVTLPPETPDEIPRLGPLLCQ